MNDSKTEAGPARLAEVMTALEEFKEEMDAFV